MKKKALIFGITGQDGSYLSRFLLSKNYIVHGVKRRSSSLNTERIDEIYNDEKKNKNFHLHYGDVTDTSSVFSIVKKINPNEIYNLAAQSHVAVSFNIPEYTSDTVALGTLRILDSILKVNNKIKFYQAGSSEMFGKVLEIPQNESTPFYPRSPYAAAKVYSHWVTVNYRESYKIFASNGILFNHESPVRGETFVTRKIVRGLCNIKFKKQKKLTLGNLYAKRDWGHAEDYVEAMWKILQFKKPDDFVISTGKQYTIKQFVNFTAKKLGIKLRWKGKHINEKAYDQNGNMIIECNKRYFRPAEVNTLLGDSTKAKRLLKWKPKHSINSLVDDMINHEIRILNNDK